MVRSLLCLPLCLLLAPSYPGAAALSASRPTQRVEFVGPATDVGVPDPKVDVIGFLEVCIKRYDETVKSYTLIFRKQERTLGTLHPWETIKAYYREQPHAVSFDWQEGERLVIKALYVAGENVNSSTGQSQILAMPKMTVLGIQPSAPDSASAKSSGRYPLSQFGLKQATQRVLATWKPALAANTLHVEYLGLHKVPEVKDRLCHVLRRHSFARPEGEDGVSEVTIYIDRETLFQVGSIVKGVQGEILGEYYFREISLNPTIPPEQFSRDALKPKPK